MSRPCHVSSPRHVERNVRICRIALPHLLHVEVPILLRHLGQIAQAQLVAKAPEDHECDNVRRILRAIKDPTAALIELFAAGLAPEAPVTLGRPLNPSDLPVSSIVTGAASGIRPGIATALAEAGSNVVMADIQKDAVEHGLSGTQRARRRHISHCRPTVQSASSLFSG
jgi:hypothetical protein